MQLLIEARRSGRTTLWNVLGMYREIAEAGHGSGPEHRSAALAAMRRRPNVEPRKRWPTATVKGRSSAWRRAAPSFAVRPRLGTTITDGVEQAGRPQGNGLPAGGARCAVRLAQGEPAGDRRGGADAEPRAPAARVGDRRVGRWHRGCPGEGGPVGLTAARPPSQPSLPRCESLSRAFLCSARRHAALCCWSTSRPARGGPHGGRTSADER